MVLDYVGCYAVEYVFKLFFSDLKPKDIAIRRPEQMAREEKRQIEAAEKRQEEMEKAAEEKRKATAAAIAAKRAKK